MRNMRLLSTLLLAYTHHRAVGFAPKSQNVRFKTSLSAKLNCGLLLSSWTDGVEHNPKAFNFLKRGLACSLLKEQLVTTESTLEQSVIVSPCCGPDTDALTQLESLDATLAAIQQGDKTALEDWISSLHTFSRNIKILYIPTALYALRKDSNNTPGKQRQRARADGKKRRNLIVEKIKSLFDDKVNVLAITLDFHDGSLKQPEGSENNAKDFPKNGREALREWSPNLVYIEGGNTFWLHSCMTSGDWQEDLLSAISSAGNAVYCGKSAGAILAGRTVETATWKGWDDPSVVDGMETYNDWKGVKGLDLVNGASFFPHMSDEWKDLVEEKKRDLGKVCCLRDEDVCLVEGKEVSVVSATTEISIASKQ